MDNIVPRKKRSRRPEQIKRRKALHAALRREFLKTMSKKKVDEILPVYRENDGTETE